MGLFNRFEDPGHIRSTTGLAHCSYSQRVKRREVLFQSVDSQSRLNWLNLRKRKHYNASRLSSPDTASLYPYRYILPDRCLRTRRPATSSDGKTLSFLLKGVHQYLHDLLIGKLWTNDRAKMSVASLPTKQPHDASRFRRRSLTPSLCEVKLGIVN